MGDDQSRLLLDIKGDLGETKGIVAELRVELREHRQEDRADLGEVKARLGEIEARQAQTVGAEAMRRHGETRRAGIVAAVVAAAIGVLSQFVQYLRH
jgi:hypothetical protein